MHSRKQRVSSHLARSSSLFAPLHHHPLLPLIRLYYLAVRPSARSPSHTYPPARPSPSRLLLPAPGTTMFPRARSSSSSTDRLAKMPLLRRMSGSSRSPHLSGYTNLDMPSTKRRSRSSRSPKKHHGFTLVIVLLGFLLPPLAVAARFGIGKDFFINVVLTLCGYFPGHVSQVKRGEGTQQLEREAVCRARGGLHQLIYPSVLLFLGSQLLRP